MPRRSKKHRGPDRLTAQQRLIVAALLETYSISLAAERLGMERKAVQRTLDNCPEVRREWERCTQVAVEAAILKLAASAGRAADFIADALDHGGTVDRVRFRAAEIVLGVAEAFVDRVRLQSEIEELKRRMETRGEDGDSDAIDETPADSEPAPGDAQGTPGV